MAPIPRRTLHIAASLGGHIEVLTALERSLEGADRTWVTSEGARAESLRGRGERVLTLPRMDQRNVSPGRLLAGVLLALRERPRTVLTSGAGVVLPFCLTARALGARVLFVETMARVDRPSFTGRVLRHVAAATFVQWPELAPSYPGATVCAPALFAGVGVVGGSSAATGGGTFVSFGNHDKPFRRLAALVEAGAAAGVLPAPVVVQAGATDLGGAAGLDARPSSPPEAFAEQVAAAEVVVCHAGAGVIATVLRAGKRPLVLPRRASDDEHVDDHQEQIAAKLDELGLIVRLTDRLDADIVAESRREVDVSAAFGALPALDDAVAEALARRGRPAAIAWGAHTARSEELAEAVGGDVRRFGNLGLTGPASAPLRWAANAVRTSWFLARRRPGAVIVQNPPIFLALLAAMYARGRRPLVLDSHPAAFGRKGDRRWEVLGALHRFVARRSRLVLVTAEELKAEVEGWGGRAALLHEAPPVLELPTADATGRARPEVLFVGVFAPDEPVAAVIEAARALPDVDVVVTGRTERADPSLLTSAPDNVRFPGYLGPDDYRAALASADVVMALTTERTSVVRAGYEAVYAEKPLVVSGWPTLRELFASAVHVDADAASIASGIREALARLPELAAAAPAARRRQAERWEEQLATLRAALTG